MTRLKFGLSYSISSPEGDWTTAYRKVVEQAMLAEKLGYDTLLISEHHLVPDGYFPSVMLACAGLATRTQRIRIGSGVILLPFHHPVSVAEDISVLDVISNGRAILGLGYGYREEEYAAFGVPLNERVSRFDEEVKIVDRLLKAKSVTYEGKYFKLRDITVTPRPIQKPRPPIWIGTKTENTVKKVARQGDAWFADPVTPLSVLRERLQAYKEALKEAGRKFEDTEFPVMREAYVAETTAKARKDGSFALNNYRDYLKWGHMQDENGRVVDRSSEETVRDELLEKRFIIGNPDECIAKIEKIVKAIDPTLLIFRVQFSGLPFDKATAAIKLFAQKVFPYFRSMK